MSSRFRDGRVRPLPLAVVAVLAALALPGCEREERNFHGGSAPPPSGAVSETDLQPGAPTRQAAIRGPYEGNAYGVSEGKRLYNEFNCSGCHFQGGGGILFGLPQATERSREFSAFVGFPRFYQTGPESVSINGERPVAGTRRCGVIRRIDNRPPPTPYSASLRPSAGSPVRELTGGKGNARSS